MSKQKKKKKIHRRSLTASLSFVCLALLVNKASDVWMKFSSTKTAYGILPICLRQNKNSNYDQWERERVFPLNEFYGQQFSCLNNFV